MATERFSGDQAFHSDETSTAADCPRCGSTNTKFCYYNNYNKSQPRHFCKSCKRHWTKGGTLRNIPASRRRRNKRAAATPAPPRQLNRFSLSSDMQNDMSDILYRALVRSSSPSSTFACIDMGVPQCTILESHGTTYTPQNRNTEFTFSTTLNHQSSGETTEESTVTTSSAPAAAAVNPGNLWNWNSEIDYLGSWADDTYALWEDFDAEYKPIFGGYYPYSR